MKEEGRERKGGPCGGPVEDQSGLVGAAYDKGCGRGVCANLEPTCPVPAHVPLFDPRAPSASSLPPTRITCCHSLQSSAMRCWREGQREPPLSLSLSLSLWHGLSPSLLRLACSGQAIRPAHVRALLQCTLCSASTYRAQRTAQYKRGAQLRLRAAQRLTWCAGARGRAAERQAARLSAEPALAAPLEAS
eukprot:3143137-Rhodomonas_salina.4